VAAKKKEIFAILSASLPQQAGKAFHFSKEHPERCETRSLSGLLILVEIQVADNQAIKN